MKRQTFFVRFASSTLKTIKFLIVKAPETLIRTRP